MISLLKRHKFSGILAATAAILLIGCSGGESGTGMQASSQQTTVGVVTGFGSVYVNGIKFNTTQATVSIDGVASSESSLSVGMVVTVTGSVDNDGINGTAMDISSRTEVKGLVSQNNYLVDSTINVMGQMVKISNDTKFKSEVTGILTIDQLVADTSIVEVSGFTDGQGNIYATYVKELASGGEVKLHGVIQDLTGTGDNSTFRIGTVTFTFHGVDTQFDDVSQAQLANGMYVYVESPNYTGGSDPLLASKISREQYADSEGSEYELEGVVTDISNLVSGEFKVNNGISIRFDTTTSFEHGVQGDIQLETILEVGGSVQADGSILADKISFRAESDMEIEGTVTSVGDNMLTISDTNGDAVVTVNQFTSYEDETSEQIRTFNFNDIMPGMRIEAKYYVDAVDVNIATSIERVMM
jgi:hypothetical protein